MSFPYIMQSPNEATVVIDIDVDDNSNILFGGFTVDKAIATFD